MDCFNKFFIEGEEVRFFEVRMWQEIEGHTDEYIQWITPMMFHFSTASPHWLFRYLVESMADEFERHGEVPDWRRVYWTCRPLMKEATPLSPA
jgi:hypothetical protein